MRLTGKRKPLFLMAARTRSRDSRTAASGRPTSSKPGRPLEMLHSTMTGYPLMPDRPTESTREVIRSPSFSFIFLSYNTERKNTSAAVQKRRRLSEYSNYDFILE